MGRADAFYFSPDETDIIFEILSGREFFDFVEQFVKESGRIEPGTGTDGVEETIRAEFLDRKSVV